MTLKRVLALAILAMSGASGGAVAQSGTNVQVPSEFPPASYTGRQYVDSKGCVYIRAGIDGQTTWVPRVTRNRKVICGFQPSLATATAEAQPAPAPAPARQQAAAPPPQQITVEPEARPQAETARTTATERPATSTTRTVRRAAPAPQAQPRVVRRAPQQAAAAPPRREAPRPAAATPQPSSDAVAASPTTQRVRTAARTVPQGQPACEGASPISAQYLRAKPGRTVRCGPQAQPYSTVISGGGGAGPAMRTVRTASAPAIRQPAPSARNQSAAPRADAPRRISTLTRVAPKHVYRKQVMTGGGIKVPSGYQRVWEDDRLNPQRAHQTFDGIAQSNVTWTRTVPRRLIERDTGREVTYRFPGLQYPYTSFEAQRAAGVTVSTRGVVVPEPIRVTRSRDGQVRRVATAPARAQAAPRQATTSSRTPAPTVSTRSAPKPAAKAASHRYVQVGIFADAAHGKRAARSLAQQGLPAKTGTLNRNGKAYTLVVAGPFGTQAQLQSALSRTRAAGYSGAKLRK